MAWHLIKTVGQKSPQPPCGICKAHLADCRYLVSTRFDVIDILSVLPLH